MMIRSVMTLIKDLSEKLENKERENIELRKKLQYSHTRINDLRYSRRQILKHIEQNRTTEL